MTWEMVDEGWGRQASAFSTLFEPSSCREYIAVHHLLGLGDGDRLLDIACGAGLAIELGSIRGAICAGIDASSRLVAVARDRSPGCDIRIGDMNALPWDDESFDVVTSFRGLWGTTPEAMGSIHRVLRPGGRLAFTIWGDLGKSPGGWMFAPFGLASDAKMQNQANMVTLGRPVVGEEFLRTHGFEPEPRVQVPFALEFADPETYARAMASTGPAFEAIQDVGEEAFLGLAIDLARERQREGLPLRGEIELFCYVGAKS